MLREIAQRDDPELGRGERVCLSIRSLSRGGFRRHSGTSFAE